ncbi:unnamed protein product [Adineta ricciae]|uniref:C2 domain-containing protein n=1 Tax=Adineta ricciae TaxID=249248 RepID=A0A813VWU9_ADIRI|nr:unnamed protein product [Adineta ricciae]CAF0844823.1 unnamed protein product [Adineta ricciae]
MERLRNIKESGIIPNLNDGLHKAEGWWKNRQDHVIPIRVIQSSPSPIIENPGQLILTVVRAEDLHQSRLSKLTQRTTIVERPYVVIECNHQRFQTAQADTISTNRNPQWTFDSGPFAFKVMNSNTDRVTIWIQQDDPVHAVARNARKVLGICDINVRHFLDQERVWMPLRRDNRPAGQLLLKVSFVAVEKK